MPEDSTTQITLESDILSADESSPTTEEIFFTSEQKKIWDILSAYPQGIDEIITQSDLEPSQVSSNLLILEMQGFVHLLPGHRYARKQ